MSKNYDLSNKTQFASWLDDYIVPAGDLLAKTENADAMHKFQLGKLIHEALTFTDSLEKTERAGTLREVGKVLAARSGRLRPVYETDQSGKIVRDSKGDKVPARDENGDPVYEVNPYSSTAICHWREAYQAFADTGLRDTADRDRFLNIWNRGQSAVLKGKGGTEEEKMVKRLRSAMNKVFKLYLEAPFSKSLDECRDFITTHRDEVYQNFVEEIQKARAEGRAAAPKASPVPQPIGLDEIDVAEESDAAVASAR